MTTEITSPTRAGLTARTSRASILSFPVLDHEPGNVGRRLAALPGEGHPVWTYLCGVLLAFTTIAGLSILCGLIVTRLVLHVHGAPHDDDAFVSFLARHRSAGLTDASLVGSVIAGGVVLPIVAGIALVVFAVARHWRLAGFLLLTLAVESGVLPRDHARHPPAPAGGLPTRAASRRRQLPVRPYGRVDRDLRRHRAAASRRASRAAPARIAVWTVAALVTVFVAFARMYRGMHHPLDVVGGVLIGVAALRALVLVSRAAHLAARRAAG